jgi:hypothetical protein
MKRKFFSSQSCFENPNDNTVIWFTHDNSVFIANGVDNTKVFKEIYDFELVEFIY